MSLSSQATAEFGQSSSTNEPKVQPKQYFGNRMEYAEYALSSSIDISDVDFGKVLLITQTADGTITLPPAGVSAGGRFRLVLKAQSDHTCNITASTGEVVRTSVVYINTNTLVLNNSDISFRITGSGAGAGATQLEFFCDGASWYAFGITTEVAAF